MGRPARIAAIHDLSSFGRCSLSVVVPILSVQGLQVCSVPTVLLSTHTGGFKNFVLKDLDDYLTRCLNHWIQTGIEVECVYSGFLSCAGQIDEVKRYLNVYKNAFKVVDPVLGDNGKPYQTVDKDLILEMRRLVGLADLITPNATEVALLMDMEYTLDEWDVNRAKSILKSLQAMGPKQVVVTGKEFDGKGICNLCYDGGTEKFHYIVCNYLPAHYPGTGDMFTSVLTGQLLKGKLLSSAMTTATEFVERSIRETYRSEDPKRDGVFLERILPMLLNADIPDRTEQF